MLTSEQKSPGALCLSPERSWLPTKELTLWQYLDKFTTTWDLASSPEASERSLVLTAETTCQNAWCVISLSLSYMEIRCLLQEHRLRDRDFFFFYMLQSTRPNLEGTILLPGHHQSFLRTIFSVSFQTPLTALLPVGVTISLGLTLTLTYLGEYNLPSICLYKI